MAQQIQEGTFLKKDGTRRFMRFYSLKDMSDGERASLGIPAKSSRPAPAVEPGAELVWDIDAQGFRVFNWNTAVAG